MAQVDRGVGGSGSSRARCRCSLKVVARTNLIESDPAKLCPAKLWEYYLQLVAIEEAFKTLKGDLSLRPVFHQDQQRIEAHIFIAFLAYCLHVTLGQRLKQLAPGLTSRSVLEKFGAVQLIDVFVPTTDGRQVSVTRYTQPEPELNCCWRNSSSRCPFSRRRKSPPPRPLQRPPCSADLLRCSPDQSITWAISTPRVRQDGLEPCAAVQNPFEHCEPKDQAKI